MSSLLQIGHGEPRRIHVIVKKHIELYDTTLRDGSQSEDVSFTVEDKLHIAERLDFLGLHYIEAGWPGASPKDTEFFQRAKKELKLKKSKLTAFGSTRRADQTPQTDPILNQLLDSEAKVLCIFGKTWDLQVKNALNIPLKDNLILVEDSVGYLKKKKRKVFFDAEHFFDGYKANKNYALSALKAAAKGGADTIILCDTNGGTLPHEIFEIVKAVKKVIRKPLGIHCHNDTGVAVANSVFAVRAGVTQVQGTINGIGERCGNANLCTIAANLELKMGYSALGKKALTRLMEVSQFVDEMANRVPNNQQPYVGRSAFAHKGGMHVNAILKDRRTYEHIHPQQVGNQQRILVSELSGAATLAHKAQELGLDLQNQTPEVRGLLAQLKKLENQGYQFEGAEASFEILVRKALGQYKTHFFLKDLKVIDSIVSEGPASSRAAIHLTVEGKDATAEAVGVGPVHALDQALHQALEKFYPEISQMRLIDYKVRVLPADSGTASAVRVLIECGDHEKSWGTVGVSENVIHASFAALVDAIDYKLFRDRK